MSQHATLDPPVPAPTRPTAPRRRRDRGGTILVLPALIPVALLSVWPLLQGIYLAFTDTTAGRPGAFVGLGNFADLGSYGLFWDSFKIGLIWAVSVTVLQFLLALGLAVLLNMRLRGAAFARVLALIPWAMPPVIIAIMWKLMYDPRSGPVNGILSTLGIIDHNVNWLGDFSTALPAVVFVGVWVGMPATTVVLLAGLQSVDPAVLEAGSVDGANTWQRFWHLVLPSLRPVIVAITTLDFIWSFNEFGLVYVLTAGGPGGKTMLPMLFAYNEAFKYGNFGLAAAMGVVTVVVIVLLMFVYLRAQRRAAQ
ncbi:carbohydrate ABC transporter permease [Actinocatenispora comari]|uniref:Transporter integral membrane protein n=1 Tax=Actinocatenispora comari TaxID=2807577 RepID=A0A8J4AAW7_9ACTN|nr:sugar ABC transporter permease [Actinocatenispora comari]GIL26390.1 transporter integral membrane protein [Actinocatenispora comari]